MTVNYDETTTEHASTLPLANAVAGYSATRQVMRSERRRKLFQFDLRSFTFRERPERKMDFLVTPAGDLVRFAVISVGMKQTDELVHRGIQLFDALSCFRCVSAAEEPANGFAKSHAIPLCFVNRASSHGREKGSFEGDSSQIVFSPGTGSKLGS
jgi:hypothetical protein